MGTRSLTRIQDGDGREIVVMYRQLDGYPSGHGVELAKYLNGFRITNGLSAAGERGKTANGMRCLAAQIIAHFKKAPGGFYLFPAGSNDLDEDYIYTVGLDSPDGLTGRLTLKVQREGEGALLFDGYIDSGAVKTFKRL